MCNLYSVTKGQTAIRELVRAMYDRTGNMPPLPGVFPDYAAPIVQDGAKGRELAMARWGMPTPPKGAGFWHYGCLSRLDRISSPPGARVLATAVLIALCQAAPAPAVEDQGRLHHWFEIQHNTVGVSCCGEGDGRILADEDWRAASGRYEVRIDALWIAVPYWAARDSKGGANPTGKAVVWITRGEDWVQVICFAPGSAY